MHDGFGPLQGAAGAGNGLIGRLPGRRAELLQAGGNHFSQMRLLVAVGNLDGFFELAVLQRAGNLGREFARLLAGGREVKVTVDHDGQGPDRLNEQDDGHGAGHPCHVIPELQGAEADCLPSSWKSARLLTVCEAKCAS